MKVALRALPAGEPRAVHTDEPAPVKMYPVVRISAGFETLCREREDAGSRG